MTSSVNQKVCSGTFSFFVSKQTSVETELNFLTVKKMKMMMMMMEDVLTDSGGGVVLPYDIIDVVPVDALQTLCGETHRYDVWINI